jgi:hypothetical protein
MFDIYMVGTTYWLVHKWKHFGRVQFSFLTLIYRPNQFLFDRLVRNNIP